MRFTIKDLQALAEKSDARIKRRAKGPVGLPPIYIKIGKYGHDGVKSKVLYDGDIVSKKGRKPVCSFVIADFDVQTGDLVGIELV
jgi:hypothetical protein